MVYKNGARHATLFCPLTNNNNNNIIHLDMNKDKKTFSQKCKLCDYEWESIKETPKQCPNCKRMDWNDDKVSQK